MSRRERFERWAKAHGHTLWQLQSGEYVHVTAEAWRAFSAGLDELREVVEAAREVLKLFPIDVGGGEGQDGHWIECVKYETPPGDCDVLGCVALRALERALKEIE